jgi:hypothetical protein
MTRLGRCSTAAAVTSLQLLVWSNHLGPVGVLLLVVVLVVVLLLQLSSLLAGLPSTAGLLPVQPANSLDLLPAAPRPAHTSPLPCNCTASGQC